MAVRGGIVLWGVWGGFPPIIGRTWPPVRREGGFGGDPPPHYRGELQAGSFHHGRVTAGGAEGGGPRLACVCVSANSSHAAAPSPLKFSG